MLLHWKPAETLVLLCRKAEQADRHIAVNDGPQGRHTDKANKRLILRIQIGIWEEMNGRTENHYRGQLFRRFQS